MENTMHFNIEAFVEGEYDVVVCGGGTAGVVAAVAAARNGAKTALLEGSYFLGGMMSGGNAGLTKFIKHGLDAEASTKIVEELRVNPKAVQPIGGIPLEITHRLIADNAAVGTGGTGASYVYPDSHEFKIYLFELLRDAGVEVFLHTSFFGLIKEDCEIKAVTAYNKEGLRVFKAKAFIDSTGDGDVAAKAGVPFVIGVGPDDSVYKQGLAALGTIQNVGSMFRIGGVDFDRYVAYLRDNPDGFQVQRFGLQSYEAFLEAYDKGEMIIGTGVIPGKRTFQIYNYPRKGVMVGCISIRGNRNGVSTRERTLAEYDIMIEARRLVQDLHVLPGFEEAYVMDTPQAGIRETRHFNGEYNLNVVDIQTRREFEDGIGRACHPVDIGPMPKEIEDYPSGDKFSFNIPYRCLIPEGVGNLLMAGRNVCSTREAAGCTRPTVPCMVTGEAAGTAAAMYVTQGLKDMRTLDYGQLRGQLTAQGAIV
jgi:hypothetical protein